MVFITDNELLLQDSRGIYMFDKCVSDMTLRTQHIAEEIRARCCYLPNTNYISDNNGNWLLWDMLKEGCEHWVDPSIVRCLNCPSLLDRYCHLKVLCKASPTPIAITYL